MRRCVIIGGAVIEDYDFISQYIKKDDFKIFCDCGLRHMERLRVKPDLVVGDFDSHLKPKTEVETIVLPKEKNDTDSFYAAKVGVERGFDEFLLLGVIGGRLEHTMANLSILLWLHNRGKRALAVYENGEIEIVGKEPVGIPDYFRYFSLITMVSKSEGVNIVNSKFNLKDGVIDNEYQYGVSNEVLQGMEAVVSVEKGALLLIKDRGN